MFFNKKKKNNKIAASEIEAMIISGDIINVNNKFGHFAIGDETGKNIKIKVDNKILTFKGGILVGIEED